MRTKIALFFFILTISSVSCKKKASLATLTTIPVTSITATTASSGGNISSDGGASVTSRGVCWDTTVKPTVLKNNTENGTGIGSFTSNLNSLLPETKYYVRAYAVTSAGIAYGNELSFTTDIDFPVKDADNNGYNTVTIGTQVWMKENLKTTKYNDGTTIPNVTGTTEWQNLLTPGYVWFNNDQSTYKNLYGALYNWYAVNTGKLCPSGWHVPSDSEWKTLEMYLGMTQVQADSFIYRGTNEASKLKSTSGWGVNDDGTNTSGFTALPGSCRSPGVEDFVNASFGNWWTSTLSDTEKSISRGIGYLNSRIARNMIPKNYGFSVRCVKD